MLDKSGLRMSWQRISNASHSPEKSTARMRQMQRELVSYRECVNEKNEEIQYLKKTNQELREAIKCRKPGDKVYECSLEEQIERLTVKLGEKNKENEKIHQKYTSLDNQMAALEDYVEDLERERKFLADKLADIEIHAEGDEMVGELENKMVLMSTEIMRLGQLTRTKGQEVAETKFRIKELSQQKQALESNLFDKERLVSQYREKLRAAERMINELESHQTYGNQTNSKILSQEIQRLNLELSNKIQEINTLEHRVRKEQQLMSPRNKFTEQNIRDLEEEIERINKSNTMYKNQIYELEEAVKRHKRESMGSQDEKERMARQLKKVEGELEEMRQIKVKEQNAKISIEIETHQRTIREQQSLLQTFEIQEQKRTLALRGKFEEQLQYLKGLLQEGQEKSNHLQRDILKYEEKLVLLSQEVERLSLQNSQYLQENAELKRLRFRLESKEREARELERVKEMSDNENRRQRQEIERLKEDIDELWKRNNELEGKQYQLKSLNDELAILNDRLDSKTAECRALDQKVSEQLFWQDNKLRIQELENQLCQERRGWETKNEELRKGLEEEISSSHHTISQLQARLTQISSEQSSTETNYLILVEEIQRLNQVLSDGNEAMLQQKREIKLLESNLQASQISMKSLKSQLVSPERVEEEIKKHIEVYKKEREALKEENESMRRKLQELLTEGSYLEKENGKLRVEQEDSKARLKNKEKEVQNLLTDLGVFKKNEHSLSQIIAEIQACNSRMEKKMGEIEQDYIYRLNQASREKQNLERECLRLDKEAREREAGGLLRSKDEKIRSLEEERNDNLKKWQQEIFEKLNASESEIRRKEREIGELNGELRNKNLALQRADDQIRGLESKLQHIEQQANSQYRSKVTKHEQLVTEYESKLSQRQEELRDLRRQAKQKSETFTSKQTNYKNELTAIRHKFQEKVAMLSQELERLNTVIVSKNNEIQNLRDGSKSKQQALEMNRQNKETIDILGQEISRLNIVLCEHLEKMREMEKEIENREREMNRGLGAWKKNEEGYKQKIFLLEEEVEQLAKQKSKLSSNNKILTQKIEDLHNFESNHTKMREKLSEVQSERNHLKQKITDISYEHQTLQLKYEEVAQRNTANSKASIKIADLEENIRQLERKLTLILGENEQLVGQIQRLKDEVEKMDNDNNRMNREMVRLSSENVNTNREKEKYRLMSEEIMSKVHQISQGETNDKAVKHLEKIKKEYENKIALMAQEIERLSVTKGQGSNINMGFGSSELKQKYEILESIHVKLKREYDSMKEKLNEYDFKMKKLKGQFELINKLTHEYKDENEYLRGQNHSQCLFIGTTLQNQAVSKPTDPHIEESRKRSHTEDMLVKHTLNSEIDRLSVLNGSLRRELEDQRVHMMDGQSLRVRMEEMMALFVIQAAQLDSVRSRSNT